jgi:hypothetical protein
VAAGTPDTYQEQYIIILYEGKIRSTGSLPINRVSPGRSTVRNNSKKYRFATFKDYNRSFFLAWKIYVYYYTSKELT